MIPQEKLDRLNELICAAHKKWPDGECLIDLSVRLPNLDTITGAVRFNWKCENIEIDGWGIDRIIELLDMKTNRGS